MDSSALFRSDERRRLLQQQECVCRRGMSLPVTILFLLGFMAGTGVLTLPKAVEDTGWIGMVLISFLGAIATYTGILLGWSWDLVEERYGFVGHTQDPYPLLAQITFGRPGRIIAKVCIYITVFGSGVTGLLLSADLLTDFLNTMFTEKHFSFCLVVLVLGCLIIPVFWLGTPVDLWPVSIVALVMTLTSCGLIIAHSTHLRGGKNMDMVQHDPVDIKQFSMAIGMIAFVFFGHATLPTIQQDMSNRRQFTTAMVVSFTGVICIYIMMTLTGYILLGNVLTSNILGTLSSIQAGWPVHLAQALLFIHMIAAVIISMNPINQDLEKVFNVPNEFCLGRVLIRTTLMLLVIFTGETIPRFSVLLSLFGGSAITVIIFVLPVCMYERLCRQKGPWEESKLPVSQSIAHAEILLVATVVFISSTVSALKQILGPESFVPPCYVNITAAKP